jgi:myo-inositol-1(or 4)-monophosphatase
VIEEVERLARGAGDLLVRHFGKLRRTDATRKGGHVRDLVSRADLEAEAYVAERLPEDAELIGEETGGGGRGARRLFVVDPLDGTVNFLHGIPFWCVSIGVIEGGALAAAVVHAPALGETFTAEAGKGARLNGEPVRVSGTAELREALLASGFAYRLDELPDDNLDNWRALTLASAGTRRFGSAAIDLAYVACGRLDGFFELHLNPWDVAAGTLLVREAGGAVTDFRGDASLAKVLHGRNLVASNGRIHDAIRARLSPPRGV